MQISNQAFPERAGGGSEPDTLCRLGWRGVRSQVAKGSNNLRRISSFGRRMFPASDFIRDE
jgi:hypothetical protein